MRPTAEGMHTMAVSVNLAKALDKAYEDSTLEEILAAPPSALAGLTEADDKALLDNLGIKTDPGSGLQQVLRGGRRPGGAVRQDGLSACPDQEDQAPVGTGDLRRGRSCAWRLFRPSRPESGSRSRAAGRSSPGRPAAS